LTPKKRTTGRFLSWLWNGKVFRPTRSLPLSDRACRYGMALFESFPVHNGKPVFLAAHLRRLKTACERCGFHVDFNAFGHIPDILSHIHFEAFVRVYVTGGDGSPVGAATDCRIFILAEPRKFLAEAVVQNGFRVAIHPVPFLPVFAGLKSGNYWANMLARQVAIERQNHEALLFNQRGELVSASMANVFVVTRGKVRTPALDSGARDGVLRSWVIERCDVEECFLVQEDLKQADEMFLTSSGIGIVPVATLEGRPLPSRSASTPLRQEYEAHLACLWEL